MGQQRRGRGRGRGRSLGPGSSAGGPSRPAPPPWVGIGDDGDDGSEATGCPPWASFDSQLSADSGGGGDDGVWAQAGGAKAAGTPGRRGSLMNLKERMKSREASRGNQRNRYSRSADERQRPPQPAGRALTAPDEPGTGGAQWGQPNPADNYDYGQDQAQQQHNPQRGRPMRQAPQAPGNNSNGPNANGGDRAGYRQMMKPPQRRAPAQNDGRGRYGSDNGYDPNDDDVGMGAPPQRAAPQRAAPQRGPPNRGRGGGGYGTEPPPQPAMQNNQATHNEDAVVGGGARDGKDYFAALMDKAMAQGAYPEGVDPNEMGADQDLVECHQCGRRMTGKALQAHAKVCEKVFMQKRKKFDMTKARVKGTEAAQFVQKNRRAERQAQQTGAEDKPVGGGKAGGNSAWRAKSNAFREAMKAARAVAKAQKEGGPLPPPSAPSEPDPSYIQCPNCGRRFNEKAAERHIPKCKDIKAKPTSLRRGTGRGLGVGARNISKPSGGFGGR